MSPFSTIDWLALLVGWAPIERRLAKPRFDAQGKASGLTAFFVVSAGLSDLQKKDMLTVMADLQWSMKLMGDAMDGTISLQPCMLKTLLEVEKDDAKRLPDPAIKNELNSGLILALRNENYD